MFYKLDSNGKLLYAYAAPFMSNVAELQVSQFNTFIEHTNVPELYNLTNEVIVASIDFINLDGTSLFSQSFTLQAHASKRFENLNLQADSYGTITVQADKVGLVMRNYMGRTNEYTLALRAE